MGKVSSYLRRHTLRVGFLAALLSLLLLVGFQFVWLARLEKVSALAHEAALRNSLDAVTGKLQSFYRQSSEEALDVPATVFASGRFDLVAAQWSRRRAPWAKRRFLVDYTRETFGNYLFFDEAEGKLYAPPASEESMAAIVACTPWQMIRMRGATVEAAVPSVDERNPDYRMILRPVLDERGQVLGVAGTILDERFLAESLFPAVARKAIDEFFVPGAGVVLTLRDAQGKVRRATGDAGGEDAEAGPLAFTFVDWRVGLQHPGFDARRWARANAVFDMTLTALLSIALLGGIVMAIRAATRAVRLSEMKSDFVSNVSHELRTPLASIRVFGELLKSGRVESPAKVREYGERIEAEGRRLSRLIENILDFSKIESGRKSYRFAEASLRETVESVLASLGPALEAGGFVVRFQELGGPLPPVRMDAEAVSQAVQNLVDNAVKYSRDAREIGVRLEREGMEALVSVTDRGIGIPAGEQKKIFERFHRVGSSLVHDVKGAGLGLSIVRHVVEAHGGRVEVESETDRGSTFRLRLPIAGPRPGAP